MYGKGRTRKGSKSSEALNMRERTVSASNIRNYRNNYTQNVFDRLYTDSHMRQEKLDDIQQRRIQKMEHDRTNSIRTTKSMNYPIRYDKLSVILDADNYSDRSNKLRLKQKFLPKTKILFDDYLPETKQMQPHFVARSFHDTRDGDVFKRLTSARKLSTCALNEKTSPYKPSGYKTTSSSTGNYDTYQSYLRNSRRKSVDFGEILRRFDKYQKVSSWASEQKKLDAQQRELSECTFKPKITKYYLHQYYDDENVHHRLYDDSIQRNDRNRLRSSTSDLSNMKSSSLQYNNIKRKPRSFMKFTESFRSKKVRKPVDTNDKKYDLENINLKLISRNLETLSQLCNTNTINFKPKQDKFNSTGEIFTRSIFPRYRRNNNNYKSSTQAQLNTSKQLNNSTSSTKIFTSQDKYPNGSTKNNAIQRAIQGVMIQQNINRNERFDKVMEEAYKTKNTFTITQNSMRRSQERQNYHSPPSE